MLITQARVRITKTRPAITAHPDLNLNTGTTIQENLRMFESISLAGLGKAVLLDRQETKYIFSQEQIMSILPEMISDFRVLEIQGARIFDYKTTYYDTADRQFFHQHMRGAGNRWKVRHRTYLNSNLSFLEAKYKDNRKRTRKTRMQLGNSLDWKSENMGSLIQSIVPLEEDLIPVLDIWYSRITLVKKDLAERITLDQGLIFKDGAVVHSLPDLMIAEVKQGSFSTASPLFKLLKSEKIYPSSFSKYCAGTILTNPGIKHNRYKPVMRRVFQITAGGNHERTQ